MKCERRSVAQPADFVTRADGDEYTIEGYFAVFDSKYWLWDNGYETIERGAFEGQTSQDVRALVNHDTTLVLGRTAAGTLELREDERGLWGRIQINRLDQDAVNLFERVKRGDVTQCSFGFDILEQEAEYPETGPTVWRIRKVRLYEVSVVTFPAYEETGVQARKAEAEEVKRKKQESWRAKMLARVKGEKHGTESLDAAAQH